MQETLPTFTATNGYSEHVTNLPEKQNIIDPLIFFHIF